MSAPRILMLDDEESLVAALVRHFERRGYEPTGAYLVAEATKAIEESVQTGRPFAAIVTDLQLPDGDGRSIVKLAREKLPHSPVVVMTGSRQGRFRQAEGGTLFLDEIGEMPPSVQAKLLRSLQEGEVQPLGADKAVKVDVRVIAATNRKLETAVAGGKFRADLYYRLNVVPLQLPPLRERREDVPALAAHFLRGKNRRLSPQALDALRRHSWPGNVRELQNLIERLTVLRPEGELQLEDLPNEIRSGPPSKAGAPQSLPAEGLDLYAVLAEVEDRLIHEALDRAQ